VSRYSQLYLERGKPVVDSVRFRRRLEGWAIQRWEQIVRQAIASEAYLKCGTIIDVDYEG
jgi:hypothetical protein